MEKYARIEDLGTGVSAFVWKGINCQTKKIVAVKAMKYVPYSEREELEEIECLNQLNHPNIVKLLDVIDQDNRLNLVLEYMETGLHKLITKRNNSLSEDEVRRFCFQVLQGLSYMHKQGYCHCDLKPSNLLVNNDEIKIGDLGLAINIRERKGMGKSLPSYVVTRPYRAPELLLKSSHYDFSIDIWAMGAVMAEIFTLSPIFNDSTDKKQIYKICSVIGSPNKQSWPQGVHLAAERDYRFFKHFGRLDATRNLRLLMPSASADAIDLIKWMFSWDPKRRPTAEQALQHPFFKECYTITRDPCYRENVAQDVSDNTLSSNYYTDTEETYETVVENTAQTGRRAYGAGCGNPSYEVGDQLCTSNTLDFVPTIEKSETNRLCGSKIDIPQTILNNGEYGYEGIGGDDFTYGGDGVSGVFYNSHDINFVVPQGPYVSASIAGSYQTTKAMGDNKSCHGQTNGASAVYAYHESSGYGNPTYGVEQAYGVCYNNPTNIIGYHGRYVSASMADDYVYSAYGVEGDYGFGYVYDFEVGYGMGYGNSTYVVSDPAFYASSSMLGGYVPAIATCEASGFYYSSTSCQTTGPNFEYVYERNSYENLRNHVDGASGEGYGNLAYFVSSEGPHHASAAIDSGYVLTKATGDQHVYGQSDGENREYVYEINGYGNPTYGYKGAYGDGCNNPTNIVLLQQRCASAAMVVSNVTTKAAGHQNG